MRLINIADKDTAFLLKCPFCTLSRSELKILDKREKWHENNNNKQLVSNIFRDFAIIFTKVF